MIGVGDHLSGSFIGGQQSRQDESTLRQVAIRTGGEFHNGNRRQVPSDILNAAAKDSRKPLLEQLTLREYALIAVTLASFVLALLPVLRSAGVEGLPSKAAQAFQKVAWPAFGLAFVTGIWNILAVDMANTTFAYSMVFGIKFLLVLISGAAAFVHARTDKASIRGMTGGIGFLAAVVAMFLGFVMGH